MKGGVQDEEVVMGVGVGGGCGDQEGGGVAEVGKLDHLSRQAGCPLEDLRADVAHEGAGAPSSEEHDAEDGGVGKEECHGGTRAKGVGANVRRMIAGNVEVFDK
ncbi:hypothetical protein ACA910_013152 [Epithemia clementina (nom. ined.)]